MLQVRNVPDEIHRTLKARAESRGLALSDYAPEVLRREISRPSRDEMLRRFQALTSVEGRESAASRVQKRREGR
jgi:plasmid stability protein